MTNDPTPRPRCVVTLDETSISRGNADQEHERAIALYDLNEDNAIAVPAHSGGPYALRIALQESRLMFEMSLQTGELVVTHILSLTPFRRLLKDYFMVCESYYSAIRTATPSQIEAIDMGRRGLHNDGARLLAERLAGKLDLDSNTARRIFTLVTALHWKG